METEKIYSTLAEDPDFGELVEMYVDEMPDRIGALQEVREANDCDGIRRLSHQIKGSAKGYGFEVISLLAGNAERAAIEGVDTEALFEKFDQLIDALERVSAGTP